MQNKTFFQLFTPRDVIHVKFLITRIKRKQLQSTRHLFEKISKPEGELLLEKTNF